MSANTKTDITRVEISSKKLLGLDFCLASLPTVSFCSTLSSGNSFCISFCSFSIFYIFRSLKNFAKLFGLVKPSFLINWNLFYFASILIAIFFFNKKFNFRDAKIICRQTFFFCVIVRPTLNFYFKKSNRNYIGALIIFNFYSSVDVLVCNA